MQALNWLLKSVTQPICLHDLLWWFVTSLCNVEVTTDGDDVSLLKKEDEQVNKLKVYISISTLNIC